MISKNRRNFAGPLQSQGVTLIEILITVLVLSIGLLGVAALQSFALQSNQYADQQTKATNIAYEVADFMRVDTSIRNAGTVPDISRWETAAGELLPNGEVNVVFNDPTLTVTVSWSDDRFSEELSDDDSVPDSVEMVTQI